MPDRSGKLAVVYITLALFMLVLGSCVKDLLAIRTQMLHDSILYCSSQFGFDHERSEGLVVRVTANEGLQFNSKNRAFGVLERNNERCFFSRIYGHDR